MLALPLEYLHDHCRLPRVDQLRAFPGGDADLEPDLDPARPFPLGYIIADHTPIRRYRHRIPGVIPVAFLLLSMIHCLSLLPQFVAHFWGLSGAAGTPHYGLFEVSRDRVCVRLPGVFSCWWRCVTGVA
ncbi:MAG: hypothetical protein ACRDPF_00810, partial [Streptosporangiaceae bacterium]